MAFYENLRELALIPSESGEETEVAHWLKKRLTPTADYTETDNYGNVYFLRKGAKNGTIVLAAHMDKRMQSNRFGEVLAEDIPRLDTNLCFDSKARCFAVLKSGRMFVQDGIDFWPLNVRTGGNLEKELEIVEIPLGWGNRKMYFPCGISADTKEVDFGKGKKPQDVFGLVYAQQKNKLYGKFDDAMGMSFILDILEETNPEQTPTILAVFTAEEEIGLKGARFIADKKLLKPYNPEKIIVFDTTMLLKLGEGFALYEKCGRNGYSSHSLSFSGRGSQVSATTAGPSSSPVEITLIGDDRCGKFDNWIAGDEGRTCAQTPAKDKKTAKEPHIADIEEFAKQTGAPMHTKDCFLNDSVAFAETGIPTCALEPPIENMHSAVESCQISDIEALRKFAKALLTR